MSSVVLAPSMSKCSSAPQLWHTSHIVWRRNVYIRYAACLESSRRAIPMAVHWASSHCKRRAWSTAPCPQAMAWASGGSGASDSPSWASSESRCASWCANYLRLPPEWSNVCGHPGPPAQTPRGQGACRPSSQVASGTSDCDRNERHDLSATSDLTEIRAPWKAPHPNCRGGGTHSGATGELMGGGSAEGPAGDTAGREWVHVE
eukprot:scaffold3808_cov112-Isochrysis_galbana.AAC.10